ncbi:hypothetical protein M758_7G006900 [Ceratodon purpureus]|uniref:Uncharacterized protein n=1 Tax=Ceratodon purpureus TaxID=3225 RepID=A0A8T0H4M1_CERPU|nr:hypothetical protein KC19_7G007200 [Ceratodon purpureus]KAG0609694.1 hypothetical protein M758_7G006900 [Ceratodon purpureus]
MTKLPLIIGKRVYPNSNDHPPITTATNMSVNTKESLQERVQKSKTLHENKNKARSSISRACDEESNKPSRKNLIVRNPNRRQTMLCILAVTKQTCHAYSVAIEL